MLSYVSSKGLEAIELGTGGYPGDAHCKMDELLNDENKLRNFKQKINQHGLIISALSCHANPLHPQKKIADLADELLVKTISLAS
ncbi:hypothetical protein JQK62_21975, partial [Leptospira santarosai]|nr:hypothetical protein [Leptospira santarosai]